MGHLMTNHSAHRAKIDRIVRRGVEERRLQNGGGKHDLIEVGVVVRVDLLREHQPAGAVGGRVCVAHLPRVLKGKGSLYIAEVIARGDTQLAVVHPLVGVANLHIELIHLLQRLFPCRLRHPLHLPQPMLERSAHILHSCERPRLRLAAKVLFDIQLAHCLPQCVLNKGHRALPARLLLLLARERLREELKVGIDECLGQVLCVCLAHMPAKVRPQLVGGRGFEQSARHRKRRGRVNVYGRRRRFAHQLEIAWPLHRTLDQRCQLGRRILIVAGVRISPLAAGEVGRSEFCLELHHRRRLYLGHLCLLAQHRQRAGDVRLIQCALLRFVFIKIVVAVWQAQPRLVELHQRPLTLLVVGTLARGKEDIHTILRVQLRDRRRLIVGGKVARSQDGSERRESCLLHRILVHHRVPEGSHFLCRRVRYAAYGGGQPVEELFEPAQIGVVQRDECVPRRILRRDRMCLHPFPVGVLEEVACG
mmetsp:Transcript_34861/g.79078  ORF Transcript_34861/g.79078 Transcript_34861/m.79078 type:complete len:477 (-) Transcript_34861:153-1583(-)